MKTISLLLVCLSLGVTGCSTILSTLEISPPFFTGFDHLSVPETAKDLSISRYCAPGHRWLGEPFVYYTYAKQREKQLRLEEPELSQADRILRVWGTFSSHPRRQPGFLAEFTFADDAWTGRFYDYRIRYDEWKHFEKIKSVECYPLVPEGGWDRFDNMLLETGFVDLPTDQYVPGLRDWLIENRISTTTTYSIEYSTPQLYRFFIFQNPQKSQTEFEQPAKFMQFFDYLCEIARHSYEIQASAQSAESPPENTKQQ